MDKRYAILDANNKALNFILWDGESEFDYGQAKGNTLVKIPEGVSYGFGWTWDGEKFINPNPPTASEEIIVP